MTQEIFPVEIIESKYADSSQLMAVARISYNGKTKWVAYCPSDMSASYYAIRDAYDSGVLSGELEPKQWVDPNQKTLQQAKNEKISEIDLKTAELIRQGFLWNGNRFSMSDAAQRNWIGLGAMAGLGMMQYPMPVSTVDEGISYINNIGELMQFLASYAGYQTNPQGPLGSGRALKSLVNAAQTVDEVEAISDDR